MTLALPSRSAEAGEPEVTATGRHRVVPHRVPTLPVVLLADAVRSLARTGAAAVNWQPWLTTLTFAAGVALLTGIVEEGWEFAFSGDVWDLLSAVAFLIAAALYGVRTATGAGPRSVAGDVVFFLAAGLAVTKETVDLGFGGEWPHAVLFTAITVAACIYSIRCFQNDQDDRSTTS